MGKRLASKVLLIGWDAADWLFLNPLLDAGKMPNLLGLIEAGTSGNIATLQPVLSPILWTSIVTGKRGDKHGVLSFIEPRPDGKGIQTVTSYSRRSKTLWNILSQSGLSSVVVNWFASHPAEPIRGAIVTNRYSEAASREHPPVESSFHPRDLASVMEQLQVTPGKLTPQQMLPFFPTELPADDDPRLQTLARIVAQTASVHNAATYLAEAEEWDFLAVYYDMIDHVGHGFMEYAAPRLEHVTEKDFAVFQHVVENTYLYHDLMLGRWLELAGDDTTVLLLSDHGFHHGAGRPLAERGRISGEPRPGINKNPLVWHRLHGVFAARGPSLKKDALVQSASLLDVAPTVLALLGLPIPDDFEGKVLTSIFAQPVEVTAIDSYEAPHPDDGVHRDVPVEEKDPWAAQAALQQLAELGYIEPANADSTKAVETALETRDSQLAQIYFTTGRHSEALELLNGLVQRSTDPGYPCRQAMCLLGLGDAARAHDTLQKVLAVAPHFALAKMLLGTVAMVRNDQTEAARLFREVGEAEAQMPVLHYQVALLCLRQLKWNEAAALFRRSLVAEPDFAEAHDGLGVALRHLGNNEDSIFHHMKAISLQHDRAQAHINLGISLAQSRQLNWAVRAFEVAIGLAPTEPHPHRYLAQIYRRLLPDREKARRHLLKARDLRRQLRRAAAASAPLEKTA